MDIPGGMPDTAQAHRDAHSDAEDELQPAGSVQGVEGDLQEGGHDEACHDAGQEGEAPQLLAALLLQGHRALS